MFDLLQKSWIIIKEYSEDTHMNFLLFLGPIIGVAVSIFAVVVIISVIGAVAGSEEDFDE